jgi:adenylosuccinate synthase
LGIAPRHIGDVFGIFKAYCTRVGSGPFPSELENATGEMLRKKGFEFGATTGRPRRCGWLDLPALNYAIEINGVNKLIMTKADVLDDFDTVGVCTMYKTETKEYFYPPYEICRDRISPALAEMQGWMTPISSIRDFDALPANLRTYVSYIESAVKTKVTMISTGPDRSQIIER